MEQKFFWDENLNTVHSCELTDNQIVNILKRVQEEVKDEELSEDVNTIIKQIKNKKSW